MSYRNEKAAFSSTCPPVSTTRVGVTMNPNLNSTLKPHSRPLTDYSNTMDARDTVHYPSLRVGSHYRVTPRRKYLNVVGKPLTTPEVPANVDSNPPVRTKGGTVNSTKTPTNDATEKETQQKKKLETLKMQLKQARAYQASQSAVQQRYYLEDEEEKARLRQQIAEWESWCSLLGEMNRTIVQAQRLHQTAQQNTVLSTNETVSAYAKDSELLRRLFDAENRCVMLEKERQHARESEEFVMGDGGFQV